MYFFHGFFDGVVKSVGGTINFIIDDAWETETWKSFGKTLYAIALPSSSEGQMMSKAIAEKASNADIYDWGDFTGQVVTAAVGTKGVGVATGGVLSQASSKLLTKVANITSKTLNKGKHSVYIKEAGKKAMRYDLKGAAHAGVPTPHKQPYNYNLNPKTGASNFSRAGKLAYPMGWGDMMKVIGHLLR